MSSRAFPVLVALVFAVFCGSCFMSETETPDYTPCKVRHRVTSEWPGGFQVNVAFTWTGGPLSGWALQIDYASGSFVVNGWSARWSQAGPRVTAANHDYNATVHYGQTVDGLGFNATGGAAPHVRAVTLNGTRCTPH